MNLTVIGLLAAVVIKQGRGALATPWDVLIGAAAFAAAGPIKRDPIAVLLAAGGAGLIIHLLAPG